MTRLLALLGLIFITACTNPNDLDEAPAYLGNFQLGHNVVVAPNLTKGPASREASEEEWVTAVTEAMTDRFTRYRGPGSITWVSASRATCWPFPGCRSWPRRNRR